MSEEEKQVKEECCCKKALKKIIIIALGVFIGAFCALSFFDNLNRPKIPFMYGFIPEMQMPYKFHHHGDCKCHKKFMKKFIENQKHDFEDKMENDK